MDNRRDSKKARGSVRNDESDEETALDTIEFANGALVLPTHYDGDLVFRF